MAKAFSRARRKASTSGSTRRRWRALRGGSGAVPHDVLGIFQLMAGEDGDHIRVARDLAGAHQLADAGDGGGGSRFTGDAVLGQHALGFEDFFISDALAEALAIRN